MHEYEQKRNIRKFKQRIYSLPSLIILAVVLFFVLQGVWSVGQKSLQTDAVAQDAAASLADLHERENRLEKEIQELKEPFGIEAQIREKYGYIKEGEEMVIVTDEKAAASEERQEDKNQTFLERVFGWF